MQSSRKQSVMPTSRWTPQNDLVLLLFRGLALFSVFSALAATLQDAAQHQKSTWKSSPCQAGLSVLSIILAVTLIIFLFLCSGACCLSDPRSNDELIPQLSRLRKPLLPRFSCRLSRWNASPRTGSAFEAYVAHFTVLGTPTLVYSLVACRTLLDFNGYLRFPVVFTIFS